MIVVVLVINLIICSIGLIEVLLVGIDLVLFVDEDLFFKIDLFRVRIEIIWVIMN